MRAAVTAALGGGVLAVLVLVVALGPRGSDATPTPTAGQGTCTEPPTASSPSTALGAEYRGFVDLFMVISVGLSALVVALRIVFREDALAVPSVAGTSTLAAARGLTRLNAGPRAVSMSNLGTMNASSATTTTTTTTTTTVAAKRGSVKERLEAEIRALLPRRSTYYAMPFFADTVATKHEFIDGLLELGDEPLDGWLLVKRGIQRGKNWKKRYVVLDGNGRIKYYPNAEAARRNANIKGSLTVHAVKPADPIEFGANTLEIRGTLGGTYFVRTEDEMAARKWLCVLTKRAIQGRVPGRIDATPSAAVLARDNDNPESSGSSSAALLALSAASATATTATTAAPAALAPSPSSANVLAGDLAANGSTPAAIPPTTLATAPLKSHKLEALVEEMTYNKEASLRQFYVVVKFKSELHDHSAVPVGQTAPKPSDKGVVLWQDALSWNFQDHPCNECFECQDIGSTTGTFKGLPDIMVLQVYEIHLRYLTTKIGQVAISLRELFGFTGMKDASMYCTWPVMSSADAVLGQLTIKLQYNVDLAGGAATVPFLVSSQTERELLGEYEIHTSVKNCIEFFDLFFANGTAARWQPYYKARGDTEVEVGEWSPSKEYGGQVRVLSYRALTNASIGPATTMSTTTQHIFFSETSQAEPDKFVLESKVFLHDIPYGDCFTVEQVYHVERGPNGNLVAKSYLGIPFSKGCMFKSKIISATREGVGQSTKLMFDELNKTMDGDGSSPIAETKPFLTSAEEDRQVIGEYSLHPTLKEPIQFFEKFYANNTIDKWDGYYKQTGDTEHEVSEWKSSVEYGGQVRVVKFRAQNTAPIGPSSTPATCDQHALLPTEEDDRFIIESKLELFDIPYGDCFTVETVYVVERDTKSDTVVARVTLGIPFTKSTMFKGKITSATKDGVVKTTKMLFDHFFSVVQAEVGGTSDGDQDVRSSRAGSDSMSASGSDAATRSSGGRNPRRVMLARLNSTLDGSVALEEIFENQRLSLFGKWGPNHLLPTDRSRFTNRNGDVELSFEQVALPPHWIWTSPWKIDKSYTECDEEGWSYATDFPRFKSHLARGKSSSKRLGNSVRRRRWIRMMAYVPPESTSNGTSGSGRNSPTGEASVGDSLASSVTTGTPAPSG